MPTYEYLCLDCANKVEVVQSFSDDPLQICEVCGGKLRKVIYPVGIQFKGSGFYSTDRRASRPGKHRRVDGSAEGSSDSGDSKSDSGDSKSDSGDSKSDSKSDRKADTKSSNNSDKGSGSSARPKAAEKSA